MAFSGHLSTLALGTSGFTAAYVELGGAQHSRPSLKSSELITTDYEEKEPGDLVDGGQTRIRFFYDPDEQPPITGAKESGTITYPTPAGGATGATKVCDCFFVDFTEPTLASNQLMEAEATIEWSGTPVMTDST